jgi:hypothetical protein
LRKPGELCEGGNELMANKTLFKSLIGKLIPATNAVLAVFSNLSPLSFFAMSIGGEAT